jgi:hypothetical protein
MQSYQHQQVQDSATPCLSAHDTQQRILQLRKFVKEGGTYPILDCIIILQPNLATVKNSLVTEGHNKILNLEFPEAIGVESVDIFMKEYVLVEQCWM